MAREGRLESLRGLESNEISIQDADSHAGLIGELWGCCLGASQAEARFRIPCCSPYVVAAYRNSHLGGCAVISEAVTAR